MKLAQQNPLISARAGGPTPGKRRADGTRYCYVAYFDGNVGISGGNSGARESTYTITSNACRCWIIRSKRQSPASVDRCYRSWPANDGNPRRRPGQDKLDVPIKFIWNYAGNTLVNSILTSTKRMKFCRTNRNAKYCGHRKLYDLIGKICRHSAADLMTVEQEDIIPNDYAGNMGISFSSSLSPAKNSNANQFTDPE